MLRAAHEKRLRARAQVRAHARVLLLQPRLRAAQVRVAVAGAQERLALAPVKRRGGAQQMRLKIVHVHVLADVHEHARHRPDRVRVHALASALGVDGAEQKVPNPGVDGLVPQHDVPPQREPEVVHGLERVGRRVDAVHVHQYIPDHGHALLVFPPLFFQGHREGVSARGVHVGRHAGEVLLRHLDQPAVELVAVPVEHHVVRIAVELLERQPRRVAAVDLADGVAKHGPGLVRVLRFRV